MNVRKLMPWEIVDALPLAKAFHDSQDIGSTFSERAFGVFLQNNRWSAFGMFNGTELVGILIGLVSPHFMAEGLLAQEIMWYVKPEHRGSTKSMELLYRFEQWAMLLGATAICMATSPTTPDGAAIEMTYTKRHYNFGGKYFIKFI